MAEIGSTLVKERFNSPKIDEEISDGQDVEERAAGLDDYLGSHEYYPQDAKVVQYVQGRLDFLTDGKGGEVIVVHEDDMNAFAIQGHVVVSDGLLKILEHQEELDGLLAHEWTHLSHNHLDSKRSNGTLIGSLGSRRIHETEADFAPLEYLDKKGINPAGIMSLFKRMEGKAIAREDDGFVIDLEHGSLLDRRLNLEQAAWLVDIRNLSTDFTPIQLSSEYFDEYIKDEDLRNFENFQKLDPLSKRHFLQRRFLDLRSIDFENITEEDKANVQDLISRQRELLKQMDESLTEEDLGDLTIISILGYGVSDDIIRYFENSELNLKEWSKEFNNKERITKFFSLTSHPLLDKLNIEQADRIPYLGKMILYNYLSSVERIDLNDYREFVEKINEKVPNEFYYAPVIEAMLSKDIFNNENLVAIAAALVDTGVIGKDIDAYVYAHERVFLSESVGKYGAINSEYEFDDYNYKKIQDLASKLREFRLDKVIRIKDPFEKIGYFVQYKEDLDEYNQGYLDEDTGETVEGIMTNVLSGFTSSQLIDLLRINPSLADKIKEFNPVGSGNEPEGYDYLDELNIEGYDSKKLNEEGKLSDNLLLSAILHDKDQFLESASEMIESGLAYIEKPADLKKLIELIRKAPDRARELGFEINWEVDPKDLSKLGDLVSHAREIYLSQAYEEDNYDLLVEFVSLFPAYNIKTIDSSESSAGFFWDQAAKRLVDKYKATEDRETLMQIFALGCISPDSQILMQIPQKTMERMMHELSFSDGMDLIFVRLRHLPRHLFTESINYLIEEKAKTLDEFKMLEDALREEMDDFLGNENLMGKVAIADQALDKYTKMETRTTKAGQHTYEYKGMEPVRLLRALLRTSQNDRQLKEYLFERWWLRYRLDPKSKKTFSIEDVSFMRQPGRENLLEHWTKETPGAENYDPLSRVVTDVYLSGDAMKYAALRKILLGDDGVLVTQKGRDAAMETFFESWLDFSDSPRGERTTRELVKGLFTVGDADELYQRLNPILKDMILRIPKRYLSLNKLADEVAHRKLLEMKETGGILLGQPTVKDKEVVSRKIQSLMLGGIKEDKLIDLSNVAEQLLGLFTNGKERYADQKISPWELAINAGEKSGAVGVRMLQLAGQYFEIPEDVKERLMDTYDSMKGQSRLQAYRTLVREAEYSKPAATLLEDIVEIRPRVGGGSLMTVYEVVLKDGSVEAIAVRNPNVEYHVSKVVDLAKRTVKNAIENNPDDRNFKLIDVLLGDVQQWVHDELADPTFEEKDLRFRNQNDSQFKKFNPGNNKYRILVPESTPTDTRWFRREEFIDGKNLTSLEITEEATSINAGKINREDYRLVTSLLVRNYIYQMLDSGLVHSDIHPGNFRITPDNSSIAVFDRYNLLELDKSDKKLVEGFIAALRTGGTQKAVNRIVDYVVDLPENEFFSSQKDRILRELPNASTDGEVERGIIDGIVKLKQMGIHIPLKVSLIGKNLLVLNRMAVAAGFKDLAEAYRHTARKTDLVRFSMMR